MADAMSARNRMTIPVSHTRKVSPRGTLSPGFIAAWGGGGHITNEHITGQAMHSGRGTSDDLESPQQPTEFKDFCFAASARVVVTMPTVTSATATICFLLYLGNVSDWLCT